MRRVSTRDAVRAEVLRLRGTRRLLGIAVVAAVATVAAGATAALLVGALAPTALEATVVAVDTPHSLLLRCADGEVTASWRGPPLHGPSLARLRAPHD